MVPFLWFSQKNGNGFNVLGSTIKDIILSNHQVTLDIVHLVIYANPRSSRSLQSHTASNVPKHVAQYSAFVDERSPFCYFLLLHKIHLKGEAICCSQSPNVNIFLSIQIYPTLQENVQGCILVNNRREHD